MNAHEQLRDTTLSMIVRDTSAEFWNELRSRSIIVYANTFADVENNDGVLPDQKIDFLLQTRHFQMENLLIDLAKRHGLSHSLSLIVQNNRRHAYVFNGDVSMTQSYVQAIGNLPQPAKFREKLASTMKLPRLDLGDEPEGAFILRQLYGLIAHNPIGRRFQKEEQKLGMIQFCLPSSDCKAWALEFTIAEIADAYPTVISKITMTRSLSWKKSKDDKGAGESK